MHISEKIKISIGAIIAGIVFCSQSKTETYYMKLRKISLKARLILYDRGKILLLKQTKPNGGNYSLVGGTVEEDETARQSVIRESFEEAGIIINKKDLQLVHVLQKIRGGEQRVTLYFKANKWKGQLESKETKKFKKVEWFDLDKLPENMTLTVKHVLRAYRHGILYSELTASEWIPGTKSLSLPSKKK